MHNLHDAYHVEGYGAIWHRCLHAGSTIECEAFVVIKEPAPPRSLEEVRYLPASSMACVAHHQLDDTTSVFLAVSERAQAMGYEISGPMHELYFPAAESAFAVTEIQFPLRRATGTGLAPHHN